MTTTDIKRMERLNALSLAGNGSALPGLGIIRELKHGKLHQWWLMPANATGWITGGYPYNSLDDIAKAWRLRFTELVKDPKPSTDWESLNTKSRRFWRVASL